MDAILRTWAVWRRRWAARLFAPGTIIQHRYKIVKQLGEGSYGVAYLCQDRNEHDRLCVLKHVLPLNGNASRRKLVYSLETSMLGRLNHRAIPVLFEHFTYRGYSCFTMEYVPGASLEQLLFDQNVFFSESESLALLLRILDIISYVHTQGVVHRDIRIANVILNGEHIHLIDFGLARDVHEHNANPIPDDVKETDPMEKKLRRELSYTSDFYALGHLLLFLLYSSNSEEVSINIPNSDQQIERSWEEELSMLHPLTKKLLRRMLQAEQPYENVQQLSSDIQSAWAALSNKSFSSF